MGGAMNFDHVLAISLAFGLVLGAIIIYIFWSNWTPPNV